MHLLLRWTQWEAFSMTTWFLHKAPSSLQLLDVFPLKLSATLLHFVPSQKRQKITAHLFQSLSIQWRDLQLPVLGVSWRYLFLATSTRDVQRVRCVESQGVNTTSPKSLQWCHYWNWMWFLSAFRASLWLRGERRRPTLKGTSQPAWPQILATDSCLGQLHTQLHTHRDTHTHTHMHAG